MLLGHTFVAELKMHERYKWSYSHNHCLDVVGVVVGDHNLDYCVKSTDLIVVGGYTQGC